MATNVVPVDIAVAQRLSNQIVKMVVGNGQAESEVALLMAYTTIAAGVKQYPLMSMSERAQIVVQRGARSLCATIEEVGKMTEAEVFAEVRRG